MSNAVARSPFITVEEYLEGEKLASVKHEYVHGRVHAMSGASLRHNEISLQTATLLKSHLRGSSCRTFLLDVKVRLQDANGDTFFYYPDVFVTCDPPAAETHVIDNPRLVVEVLSPSTWRHDFGEKVANYRLIPSVEEIVLIAQDWPEVTVYRRSEGWAPQVYKQADQVIRFESVDLEVPVSALYEAAALPADATRPWYLQEEPKG